MTIHGRRAGIALLLFILFALPLMAQDVPTVTVVGSNAAGSIFSAAVEASGVETALTYDFTGTQNGITLFCQNQAAIVVTGRALTASEASACASNSVDYNEVLFGVGGYALVVSPDVDFLTCLSTSEISQLVSPSAATAVLNWTSLNNSYKDLAFGFNSISAGSRAYDMLDGVVNGDGFRNDTVFGTDAAVIAAVAGGNGQLGLVSLGAALTAEGVTVLDVNNAELGICIAPSAANVLNRSYTAGERLFAYVNNAHLSDVVGLKDALTFVLSPDNTAVLEAAGATSLGESVAAQSLAIVNDGTTGRVFSVDVDLFQAVPNTSGDVRVGGSASASAFIKASMATFTQRNPGVTLTEKYLGASAGARELCSGNLDIAIMTDSLTEEEAASCTALEIVTVPFELGEQSAVLIGNAANDALTCLTVEQIQQAWTTSAEAPTTWDAAGVGTDATEIVLFALDKGDASLNLLVSKANGSAAPAREDVNINADPLYLGAAVGNVTGGVAVMTLAQAEELINEGYAVKLLGVKGSGDCVIPSAETLSDGSYPFAQAITLLLNQTTLGSDGVQAALWSILSNTNYVNIKAAGLVGLDIDSLIAKRQALQALFADADLAEAQALVAETSAAATAAFEATVTPGQTVVPTIDANATLVPTDEPTVEATVAEPTVEATAAEATAVEPTVEATTAP